MTKREAAVLQAYTGSVYVQVIHLCHFKHCVHPVLALTPSTELLNSHFFWSTANALDHILTEIIGKAAASIFQIGLCRIPAV